MSIANTNARPARLAGAFGGIGQRFSRYRTYRRTLDELNSLSDRDLSDLGIHRSQVRGIAFQAAYEG